MFRIDKTVSTKFFTNRDHNTLLSKLDGVFKHNKDIEFFDALVGYFRASGYFAIRPFIEDVPHIRILVGINVDRVVSEYQKQGLLYLVDTNRTLEEFHSALRSDIQSAKYDRQTEEGILQFVQDIISGKIEIKAHPTRNLHAKIYIFRPVGFCEHKAGSVITGSSNLTEAGLGKTGDNSNYEFNVQLYDYADVKFATEEFESLWDESVPILPVDAAKLKEKTYLNDEATPFEVYIKFLIEYFGTNVDFDPNSVSDLPKGFKRLAYQVDAVSQGYELLRKHNGFFLADVVGLGKTIIAILIAKKFFYQNGFPNHVSETLIVCPPSLQDNWDDTIGKFGLKNCRIITNGSLHKLKHPEKYDLIIVDEAHKFRTDTAESYNALQTICKTDVPRRNEQGEPIKVRKKVILVSATPLNNSPEDIRNLVYLFQDAKESTLEVANLQRFFNQRIEDYRKAKKAPSTAQMLAQVKPIYELIRRKVVQPLTIRRTRTDLVEHEQYAQDLKTQGITFPQVWPPQPIYYPLDSKLEDLYDRTIHLLQAPVEGLTYNRYRAIGFLKPEKKAKYQNADLISSQLAKIMKTLLVKRLDSSFFAFKASMVRFRDATEAMIRMFANGRIIIAPKLKVSDYIMEDREEELISLVLEQQDSDPTIDIFDPSDFDPELLTGLQHDFSILQNLCAAWESVESDPKLDIFVQKLPGLLDKSINPERKLVVFSESAETAGYLANKLTLAGYDKILSIHAGNRKERLPLARSNFDANIAITQQDNAYDILISTEVLAEGVNLHRANVIVNYDTPWNSTRLMQRIGRVNRIGSKAPAIHIYNFYPTAKVNSDIELEKKAILKLQAFHSALGEDSQIYSDKEEIGTFGLFEKVPEEAEKDERLAYLMELREFKEENPQLFRKIKHYPLRCRVGRKDRTRSDTTLTFIRSKRRDAFYHIRPDNAVDVLTFVECARLFHANIKEKGVPLPEKHHDQVQVALQDFQTRVEDETASQRIVDVSQGPNEKKALAFLDIFLKQSFVGEEEKRLIQSAKMAIRKGKFTNLQRDINKLQRAVKNSSLSQVTLLDNTLAILKRYPLDEADTPAAPQPLIAIRAESIVPEIIISESFTATPIP